MDKIEFDAIPLSDPRLANLSTTDTDPQSMVENGSLTFGGEGSKNALGLLTPRQRQILWRRFHPENGKTPSLKAIGEETGWSRSTIRREFRVALEKIPDPSKLYFPQR